MKKNGLNSSHSTASSKATCTCQYATASSKATCTCHYATAGSTFFVPTKTTAQNTFPGAFVSNLFSETLLLTLPSTRDFSYPPPNNVANFFYFLLHCNVATADSIDATILLIHAPHRPPPTLRQQHNHQP